MHNLYDYGEMIADRVRMDAYALALKRTIRPGMAVLDIGAGTGIFSLLALKFGARRVYAVESEDAIHLAGELARENGFADRFEFAQGLSTDYTLPEPADLIISDLRGVLPLFGAHIPTIIDARQRFLAPGGQLIPRRDSLWIALVEAPAIYRTIIRPWDTPYGLSMSVARAIVLNRFTTQDTDTIRAVNLLTEPVQWADLDYRTILEANAAAELQLSPTRPGVAHGWLAWFDAELAPDIGYSNAPGQRRFAEVYGRALFPLLQPIPLAEGDDIRLAIAAELVDDLYDWSWRTRIQDAAGQPKADFAQSTTVHAEFDF